MERALRALNKSKYPGAERIPVKILKDAVHLGLKPLILTYNASLEKGIFPQVWKSARVTQIYKTGSKTAVSNGRSISVFSAISRILEQIVPDPLIEYVKGTTNRLNQFTFQKLHNTATCLDSWLKNSDEGK